VVDGTPVPQQDDHFSKAVQENSKVWQEAYTCVKHSRTQACWLHGLQPHQQYGVMANKDGHLNQNI